MMMLPWTQMALGAEKPATAAANLPGQALHFAGIVRDHETHQPVEGATVTVQLQLGHNPNPRHWEDLGPPSDHVTDAGGRYEFSVAAEKARDPYLVIQVSARHPK